MGTLAAWGEGAFWTEEGGGFSRHLPPLALPGTPVPGGGAEGRGLWGLLSWQAGPPLPNSPLFPQRGLFPLSQAPFPKATKKVLKL